MKIQCTLTTGNIEKYFWIEHINCEALKKIMINT